MKTLRTLTLGLLIVLVTAGIGLSGIVGDGVELKKDIQIQPVVEKLKVEFTSTKKVYSVGEAITFKVKVNKDAFVYLFSTSKDSEKVIQLFPNKNDQNNKVKANHEIVIPTKSTFKSDTEGTEHIVFVASTKNLNLKATQIKGSSFHSLTKFDLDKITKDIRVEPREPHRRPEAVVEEIDIIVKGKEETRTQIEGFPVFQGSSKPAIIISTDNYRYKVNEQMTIYLASEVNGKAKVFFVNPQKEVKLLAEVPVQKEKMHKIHATTTAPTGQHMLVAVIEKNNTEGSKAIEPFVKTLVGGRGDAVKDLQLVQQPETYAVYTFVIE